MSTPIIDEAAKVFADPTSYADEPRLHTALTHLRAHAPVSLVDCPPYRPFWAITKHADVMEIERANDLFINEPRPLLATADADDMARAQLEAGMGLRTLIHMDDPQHRVVRAIGADWFRPKAMRALKIRVDELAKIHVDKMMAAGNECDFAQEVAVNYPLYVIMSLLGLPESDFPRMLTLTQELFGGDDEEFKRGGTLEEQLQVLLEFFGYFNALTASRREQPTDDLASAIANARIAEGRPHSAPLARTTRRSGSSMWISVRSPTPASSWAPAISAASALASSGRGTSLTTSVARTIAMTTA
jgi:cytochrome P450